MSIITTGEITYESDNLTEDVTHKITSMINELPGLELVNAQVATNTEEGCLDIAYGPNTDINVLIQSATDLDATAQDYGVTGEGRIHHLDIDHLGNPVATRVVVTDAGVEAVSGHIVFTDGMTW